MNKKIAIVNISIMLIFSLFTVVSTADDVNILENVTYEYKLKEGWNLITLPLNVTDNSFHSIFYDLIGSEVLLNFSYGWNATYQYSELVTYLNPGYGYWIYSFENVSHNITGEEILDDLSIDLGVPNNMVGWVQSESTTAEHICQSIPGCKSVGIPNGKVDDFGNVKYTIHNASEIDTNFEIIQGVGFWIVTEDSGTWDGSVIPNLVPIANAGGPYQGFIGEEIILSAVDSYDFDGVIVNYNWSYTIEGSPAPRINIGEGETIAFSMDSEANYNITLEIEDDMGAIVYDETTATISHQYDLRFSIGIISIGRIDATIENLGGLNATDVEWNISIKGGFFGFIDMYENGSIDRINTSTFKDISTQDGSIAYKFGPVNVTITAVVGTETFKQYYRGFIIGKIFIDFTPFIF